MRNILRFVLFASIVAAYEVANAQTAVTNGYKDFSFGTTGASAPTGEKPENKLWYTPDGTWWGVLYNNAAQAYRIYKFEPATESWSDTAVTVDDRNSTKSDVLWDSATSKLYVASHTFTTTGQPTSSSSWGRLYRFSYNSGTRTYTRDTGFPVTVTNGKSETLTIAKDSTGKLWVTYVESGKVYVNRSGASATNWGAPFVLPVGTTATSLSSDDICAIVAFGGSKVGILWTNENTSRFYFAVHDDGSADTEWSIETPITGPAGLADDHVHLKTSADGRVFAVVKTNFTAISDPLVKLLVRSPGGIWSDHTVGRKTDHHTRPILLLNEDTRTAYVFATSGESGGAIYYKQTNMDNPSFPVGLGTPLIRSTSENNINDATTTKQNITTASGLLVAGSNNTNRTYYHGAIGIGAPNNTPAISSFDPTSGTAGSSVTITGANFTGATSVSFGGTSASFTVNLDTRITATVPAGAQTGKIVVETPEGTATSAADFTVTAAPPQPAISSFSPTGGGAGTAVTITGSNFTGATAVRFNTTNATFSVANSTTINTTVPTGASTGAISVETPAGTATSADSFTVSSQPAPPTISSFTPSSGPVGTQVTVTGTNFTGATSVTVNGVAAVYSVSNATTIAATVPSTTTGKIAVTTPGGTATSTNDFTVTTSPPGDQTFTLNPTADTYVRAGTFETTNFGAATILNTRTSTVPDNYRDTYLKYTLPSVTSVTSAKLRFLARMGAIASVATEVRAVADTSWLESTMTYLNRPALGNTLGTVIVSGTTYVLYEVDVTGYVQAELAAGRTTVSLALHNTTDSGTYQNIYAKEYNLTNASKLVVVGSN